MTIRGRVIELDAAGRAFCDGCQEWLTLAEVTAPGNGHRVVPGSSGLGSGVLMVPSPDAYTFGRMPPADPPEAAW